MSRVRILDPRSIFSTAKAREEARRKRSKSLPGTDFGTTIKFISIFSSWSFVFFVAIFTAAKGMARKEMEEEED